MSAKSKAKINIGVNKAHVVSVKSFDSFEVNHCFWYKYWMSCLNLSVFYCTTSILFWLLFPLLMMKRKLTGSPYWNFIPSTLMTWIPLTPMLIFALLLTLTIWAVTATVINLRVVTPSIKVWFSIGIFFVSSMHITCHECWATSFSFDLQCTF